MSPGEVVRGIRKSIFKLSPIEKYLKVPEIEQDNDFGLSHSQFRALIKKENSFEKLGKIIAM